ncbi:MAG: hypothetical protein JWN90_394 [Parcubacteria group bacterium]|nr:hypothetical protein [Parcubacteria group bacterium]
MALYYPLLLARALWIDETYKKRFVFLAALIPYPGLVALACVFREQYTNALKGGLFALTLEVSGLYVALFAITTLTRRYCAPDE